VSLAGRAVSEPRPLTYLPKDNLPPPSKPPMVSVPWQAQHDGLCRLPGEGTFPGSYSSRRCGGIVRRGAFTTLMTARPQEGDSHFLDPNAGVHLRTAHGQGLGRSTGSMEAETGQLRTHARV
jgi:hypothetical protein